MKKFLKSTLRHAAKIRNTRAWPVLRPAYRLVVPFVDLRRLAASVDGLWLSPDLFPRPSNRGAAPTRDQAALLAEYQAKGLHEEPDTFVLYRVIGNDLFPRHRLGQSRENIAWILEHEPELPGCEKRWVVNRIVDRGEEAAILRMLDEANARYLHIPFRWDEYRAASWDISGIPPQFAPHTVGFTRLAETYQGRVMMRLYRHKNNYVMNNNGARNAALNDGRTRAKWVLPWDGNCFLTRQAWDSIREGVTTRPHYPYHVVPMARVLDNRQLLDPSFQPEPNEEPQILFRRDAREGFDPEYFYGRRPKVELFWRLGVAGSWDSWPMEPWDLPCPEYAEDAGTAATTGWVARLFSGQAALERGGCGKSFRGRGQARVEAIQEMLDRLDIHATGSPQPPIITTRIGEIPRDEINQRWSEVTSQLQAAANMALARGPFSVVDKTTLAPSGDPHDYWHPDPYYWPNPLRLPGLPYVKRQGRRVPGTVLYEPESERFDRTRLQHVFDDTFVFALASTCSGDERYALHAVQLIQRWFLDSETAMNPHLRYAQVRRGHNRNQGAPAGILETKDLYYFLDAVLLLHRGGWLSETAQNGFTEWMGRYLHWLRHSEQGAMARSALDNLGTWYDLQVGSIASFLGDSKLLRATLRDSRSRILQQFEPDGSQPIELGKPATAHHCCFNLQAWVQLAKLAETAEEDLWQLEGPDGQSLEKALGWILRHVGRDWSRPNFEPFDAERLFPLYHEFRTRFKRNPLDAINPPPPGQIKPSFPPYHGIPPFWQLGLTSPDV
ncbi:MAG: alginate lyase family protein [Pirellulaceae bacterium]